MIYRIEVPFERANQIILQDIYIDSSHSPTKEDILSVVGKFINDFKGHWQTIYFILESCESIPVVNRKNYYRSCDFIFNGKPVSITILFVDAVLHRVDNTQILN